MDQRFYQTSQFAKKAAVSIRTLRYYDKMDLLSPRQHTQAGYRLYTDEDLFCLQQILALKFLGFSLEEIKRCIQTEPQVLQQVLAIQKAMLYERRTQMDTVIQAINKTETMLQTGQNNWASIVNVILVIQMQKNNDWQNKYFTSEQLEKMHELSQQSYTPEQRQQLAERGKNWTEEDQKRADQQWGAINSEVQQLVAVGADPTGPEAQAWAKNYTEMIGQFTQGDAGIEQGLKNFYQNFEQLPDEEKPMPAPYNKETSAFIEQAVAAYKKSQSNQV